MRSSTPKTVIEDLTKKGSYVTTFLLSLLDSLDMGDLETGTHVASPSSGKGVPLPFAIRGGKGIYMKINFVNADHVHVLIDLPTHLSIEEVAKLLKGASSNWINENNLIRGKFAWGRGYGAFSVSQSDVPRVSRYIAGQEEHHQAKSFTEEYQRFVSVYGLVWREENC